MKYIVELKYTNPSHEHVSLRRRVESTSRLVEAANEQEAVFRATRQQKALGFMIKEAKATVVQEATKKVDFVKFGKDILAQRLQEEVEQVNEASHVAYLKPKAGAPSDVKDHFDLPVHSDSKKDAHDKFAKVFGSNMAKHYEVVHVKPKAVKEDVEEVDEALLPKQKAVADKLKAAELTANKEKAGYKFGKLLRATKVAAKKLKEETEVQYIEEKLTATDPASKWISDFVASDNPKFAGKSKKERIQMALGAHYAAKRAKNEEVVDESKKTEQKKEDGKKAEGRENVLQGKVNKINMEPELDHTVGGVK
jgi:hypothetical protein